MKRFLLVLLSLAVVSLGAAEPYVWETADELAEPALAQKGGSITLAVLSGSRTWNPAVTREVDTARDLTLRSATLLTRDNKTLQYEPYAAESFEMSEDGTVVTVTLRPELEWSDGTPITAADYMLYYTITTDPEVESPNADTFLVGDDPVTMEMLDERTLQFNFPAANRTSLSTVSFVYPVPDHVLGEIYRNEGAEGIKAAWGTDTPVSELVFDGPFMITSYSPDERYVLKANPAFGKWNVDSNGTPLPYLDEIQFTIAAQEAQLNLFVAGELDVYSPANLDEVGVVNNAIVNEGLDAVLMPNLYPTTSTTFYSFNWNKASDPFKQEVFRNPLFRRAMSHLTPREAMVDLIYGGAAEPAYSPVTSALKQWILPEEEQVRYPFDPEAAQALLAQIGFSERNSDGFLVDAEGNELGFMLVTNSGNANREQQIQLIADTMREFGVNVETQALDFGLLVDQLLSTGDDRPFDAILIGLTAGGDALDWPFSESVQTCVGNLHMWNQSGDCLVPQERLIAELQKRGIRTLDDAEAEEISRELQQTFAQMQPMIYTTVPLVHAAWAADVGGEYNEDVLNAFTTTRSAVTTFRK